MTHNYYDEGAGEAEEETHETHNLLTKTTSGALLSSGKEEETRETLTSYSGQNNLGWKLRKPTSVTTDPGGLDLVQRTVYEPSTGNVVETRTPESEGLTYATTFGSEGTGEKQFRLPEGVAVAPGGDVYVADTQNDRVEELSATGEFIRAWGSEGTGNGQFEHPDGVAVASSGDVYVLDSENERVQEFSAEGKYELQWGSVGSGNGQFGAKSVYGWVGPEGIAVAPNGNVYVIDRSHSRVQEFTSTGEYVTQWGSFGHENGQFWLPDGIAVAADGDVYVSDAGNDSVQEFSSSGAFITKWGSSGSGDGQFNCPDGVTAGPNNDVYVADKCNDRVQEFSSTGAFIADQGSTGSGNGQFSNPSSVAAAPDGDVYVLDKDNARVEEFISAGSPSYDLSFGSEGTGEKQFRLPEGVAVAPGGDVYVADTQNDRVEELSATGEFIRAWGSEGTGNGQFEHPDGVAVASSGDVYVLDSENERVQEFSAEGKYELQWGSVGSGSGQFGAKSVYGWVGPEGIAVAPNGNVYVIDRSHSRVQEFTSTGEYVTQWGSFGHENGQFWLPDGIAVAADGDVYVSDAGNDSVQEFSSSGAFITKWGSSGSGDGQFNCPDGVTAGPNNDVYVADKCNDRVQEFSSTGAFIADQGSTGSGNGQFSNPSSVAAAPDGNLYVADKDNDRIQEWTTGPNAHDTQTAYYSAASNPTVPACGEHPEWANLPCQTQPAKQPETSGLPSLPVTKMTYNIWDEVEDTTEQFGTSKRTKAQTYDPAGRALTSETTATSDTTLPKVTNKYNEETGALEKQSATIKGETKTTTSKLNTFGQLVEYTDAEGNVAKYAYEEGSDGRLEEISEGKGKEAESKQTYSYDPTTGFLTKLIDSAAGTFTAAYDVEGNITSEIYPNGMCANTTYNPINTATHIEYIKTRNCTESSPTVWFSDSIASSIHGETLQQTSTLSKDSYAYDETGRLTETQETPTGKGCQTRIYGYDIESNRTSETTRESATEACASEGGATQTHTYDAANRLTDPEVEYEAFGNTTKLPAADAGEHELTTTYYVDNQVATQKQNGETVKYEYDPAGRTLETVSEGKTSSKVISHYAGPGEALPTWTSEGSEHWTREIPGIDGALDAIQTSGGSTVLQLNDLQGDIVATAALSESETKLLTTYNSTEFGVPQPGTTPPKYAWLGAGGLASEPSFSSGISTQDGASYVPEIGRPLQTGPIASPGSFPDGTAGVGIVQASYLQTAAGAIKGIAVEREAALEEAKRHEAEENAGPPCGSCMSPGPGEGNCEPGECVTEEEYDPEGLASYKTTMKRAQELRSDAAKGLAVGILIDLGIPGGAEGGADYAAELEISALSLEACVEVGMQTPGKAGRWGACFINETKALGVPLSAKAEFCEYTETRQWGKKPHNVYYCLESGEDRWGPWY